MINYRWISEQEECGRRPSYIFGYCQAFEKMSSCVYDTAEARKSRPRVLSMIMIMMLYIRNEGTKKSKSSETTRSKK